MKKLTIILLVLLMFIGCGVNAPEEEAPLLEGIFGTARAHLIFYNSEEVVLVFAESNEYYVRHQPLKVVHLQGYFFGVHDVRGEIVSVIKLVEEGILEAEARTIEEWKNNENQVLWPRITEEDLIIIDHYFYGVFRSGSVYFTFFLDGSVIMDGVNRRYKYVGYDTFIIYGPFADSDRPMAYVTIIDGRVFFAFAFDSEAVWITIPLEEHLANLDDAIILTRVE